MFRKGNWGTERWYNLPKVTQPGRVEWQSSVAPGPAVFTTNPLTMYFTLWAGSPKFAGAAIPEGGLLVLKFCFSLRGSGCMFVGERVLLERGNNNNSKTTIFECSYGPGTGKMLSAWLVLRTPLRGRTIIIFIGQKRKRWSQALNTSSLTPQPCPSPPPRLPCLYLPSQWVWR